MVDAKRTDEIQGPIVHVYDGIEEADNQLPRWWLATFFVTIVFGIGYWFVYHEYMWAPLPVEEYGAALATQQQNVVEVSAEELAALEANPEAVAAGREIFTANCVPCHGPRGAGDIGPNLTDRYWIHGGSSVDIHNAIRDGVLTAGMPAWGPPLGPVAVQNAAAFVLSIRNTEVEGKEPQGELYEPAEGETPAAPTEGGPTEGAPTEPGALPHDVPEPGAPTEGAPVEEAPTPEAPAPQAPTPRGEEVDDP